jgi:hypothetical protein
MPDQLAMVNKNANDVLDGEPPPHPETPFEFPPLTPVCHMSRES